MLPLAGKNIVIGVTGGIAAYKAVEVVSRLRKAGANTHVIMTREATEFVTELTFREISGNPVTVDMWAKVTNFKVEHIALANLADIMLIVPATANIIAKAAAGIADDMLSTTILATKAPLFFASAMNTNMYENPVTQENIAKLKARGIHIIEPASGALACGTSGKGRLPEPITIVEELLAFSNISKSLTGRTVIVTAGGTIEPIDPVRYIANRSTGRMGYAIAEALAARGAETILISGPTSIMPPTGVKLIKVATAIEMKAAVDKYYDAADAVVMSAAVADYRPETVADNKIKKSDDALFLKLVRNPDILLGLGERKNKQLLIGFAAETTRIDEYAQKKLIKKNLDYIVANDVSQSDAGFGVETNRVKIFSKTEVKEYPLMAKRELANIIADIIASKRGI